MLSKYSFTFYEIKFTVLITKAKNRTFCHGLQSLTKFFIKTEWNIRNYLNGMSPTNLKIFV